MRFTIRHVTRFAYDSPITESVMEARMQPRSDGTQRCLRFWLSTEPASRVLMYQDHDGNIVHYFDIPRRHAKLVLTAEALVDSVPPPALPERLEAGAWDRLDGMSARGEFWEYLAPSTFAQQTSLLAAFANELGATRDDDPLTTVRRISSGMYEALEYSQESTSVDSPIDEALSSRRGVCQDFAHIFIALLRRLGVPARYVSGYLFHQADIADRSIDGATHAWAEVLLPELGWVGIDPTNNVVTGERHVRVAIGRDYADVPPTRGVYKGNSGVKSELAVSVAVGSANVEVGSEALPFVPWLSQEAASPSADSHHQQQQQQQQQ